MISRWENNLSEPTNSYLSAYARFFNLDLNELLDIPRISDASGLTEDGYYTDPEIAELAEELRTNPEYRILFDASKNLTKEDIDTVLKIIEGLKAREGK
jgi:transcriptional regulator with XRE-family HTH domain